MNLVSFVDELVTLGGVRCMWKRAADISEGVAPEGLMRSDAPPPSIRTVPDETATRLPESAGVASQIQAGALGRSSGSKYPIDRERFNRPGRGYMRTY